MRRIAFTLVVAVVALGCKSTSGEEDSTTDTGEDTATDAGEDTVTDSAPDSPGEIECSAHADCDDSDPCTEDLCDLDTGDCSNDDVDADDDGYAAATVGSTECGGVDCDDSDDTVHPAASPGCSDTVDVDCNGYADQDNDGDGYISSLPGRDCGGDDCDDENADAFPGAPVDCSATDHDCNGEPDHDNDGDGYQALTVGGADCTGGDCDDTDASIHPTATEVCLDGIDQDCDTLVDGPMVMLTADVHVVGAGGPAPSTGDHPDIDWTGSEFLIVYDALYGTPTPQSDLWGYHFTGDGAWRGSASSILIEDATADQVPEIAWGSSTLGVVWSRRTPTDSSGMAIDVFYPDFSSDGYEQLAGDHMHEPQIAWNGSRFNVCWDLSLGSLPSDAIRCQLFDETGASASSTFDVIADPTGSTEYREPVVAWSGSEFAVIWKYDLDGADDLGMQILAHDGSLVGSTIRLMTTPTRDFLQTIAWAGSQWAVLWSETIDYSESDNLLQFVGTDGALVGSAIRIADVADTSYYPAATWTGSALAVAWTDSRLGTGTGEIFFKILDATGAALSADLQVTSAAEDQSRPRIVWTGSEIGIVWEDGRFGANRPYLNRVGFCE